ncbi:MAG: hypothetical protein H7841_01465 [Magnetospirillum sp. WYHS-4]
MIRSALLSLTAATALLLAAGVQAQQPPSQGPGQTRAQGKVVPSPKPEPPPMPKESSLFLDHREEMRRFVLAISHYARSQRKDFAIVAQNGLELLNKLEGVEESKPRPAPARAYTMALDGILVEGFHYGYRQFDTPMPPVRRKKTLPLLQQAKKAGVKILTVDYALDSLHVDDAYRQSQELGYVPFVAQARGLDLNFLPHSPKTPVNENADHILSFRDVRNFAWLVDTTPHGTEAQFALKMHETNYDLLIVPVFHGRTPLSRQAVETLRYKKLGSRRLVFAQVNIGMAAAYDYFWKPEWKEGAPSFVSASVTGNPDLHWIEYWKPEWQKIVSGDPNSYIYGVIAQGFDGIVLDGLDTYQFFEGPQKKEEDEEEEEEIAVKPEEAKPASPPQQQPTPKPSGPMVLSPAAGSLPQ